MVGKIFYFKGIIYSLITTTPPSINFVLIWLHHLLLNLIFLLWFIREKDSEDNQYY